LAGGNFPALLALTSDKSVTVEGSGVVIDARKDYVRNWNLCQDIYPSVVSYNVDYDNCDGILLYQTSPQPQGDNGSRITDMTLRGFRRAIAASHFHVRKVSIDNFVLERNIWGLFPRGANVSVRDSLIRENVLGGFYGEYNSRNWVFRENTFQDNNTNGQVSYGDVVLDACYEYQIIDNDFLEPSCSPSVIPDYRAAISLYRNRGENEDIREHASHSHLIENNRFSDYNVAIDFSVRMGRPSLLDLSNEGRCHTSDNIVRGCSFSDCKIGIMLRNNYTTVESNIFSNVEREIVMHNVFYSMHHNTIRNQPGSSVWLWSVESDYSDYSAYIPYGNGMGRDIAETEKFYHVISPQPRPTFHGPGAARLLVSPTLLVPEKCDINSDSIIDMIDVELIGQNWLTEGMDIPYSSQSTDVDSNSIVDYNDFSLCGQRYLAGNDMLDTYSSGGRPVSIAVGEMAVHKPGDEIAVIWNRAVSNIDGIDYFTIIIYDQNGNELDRCGRSGTRWDKITVGNFFPDTGYIKENDTFEIAAVQTLPRSDGTYPVYIFRKGFMEPAAVLLEGNTAAFADITAGNFRTAYDEYDEIACKTIGSNTINIIKPSDTAWATTITGVDSNIIDIAAGDFDGTASNGDEIAAVTGRVGPVLLYRTGTYGSYDHAADTEQSWTLVAGGDFDAGLRPRDEIAAASGDGNKEKIEISFFAARNDEPFKKTNVYIAQTPPAAICGGRFAVKDPLSPYERITGITQEQIDQIQGWGDHIAVLPEYPVEVSVPLFWISSNPADSGESHSRIVPLLR
jgi:parallel beta-helix repeat protein